MLEKVVTILFVSGDPTPLQKIVDLVGISKEELVGNLPILKSTLETVGLTLLVSNDEIAIVTKAEYNELVEAFKKDELKGDLTPAALQVLTLVAYLGYPTREQISYIRGVQSSQSIRSLAVRGLIARSGEVCTLTADSLRQLGITSVEELPDYQTTHRNLLEKLETRDA
jgi:segregation and condensation protein B